MKIHSVSHSCQIFLHALLTVILFLCVSCAKPGPPEPYVIKIEPLSIEGASSELELRDATGTVIHGEGEWMPQLPQGEKIPKPKMTELRISGTAVNHTSRAIPKVLLRVQAEGPDLATPWLEDRELLFEKPRNGITPKLYRLDPGTAKQFETRILYDKPRHVRITKVSAVLLKSP